MKYLNYLLWQGVAGSVPEFLETSKSFVLVGCGAITGSWIRMYLYEFFGKILPSKYWGTMIVNILAAFFLGFFLALDSHSKSGPFPNTSPSYLFACVGFLGSLSTFSTFIFELFNTLLAYRWRQFWCLAIFSLTGGLVAVAAGFILGNV